MVDNNLQKELQGRPKVYWRESLNTCSTWQHIRSIQSLRYNFGLDTVWILGLLL